MRGGNRGMEDQNNDGIDIFAMLAEQKIQEAMAEGLFDHLPGAGKPIDLSVNPFEQPGMASVNRLLKNNRVLPPWLSLEKEIETMRQQANDAILRLQSDWDDLR